MKSSDSRLLGREEPGSHHVPAAKWRQQPRSSKGMKYARLNPQHPRCERHIRTLIRSVGMLDIKALSVFDSPTLQSFRSHRFDISCSSYPLPFSYFSSNSTPIHFIHRRSQQASFFLAARLVTSNPVIQSFIANRALLFAHSDLTTRLYCLVSLSK